MTYSFSLPYHHKLNYQKNFNILVEDYKTIYFNTQKNANSSMKAQFVEVLGLTKTENFPKDIHSNYNFPTALQIEINSKYHDFLIFSILRNPWERLASCYKNKIKKSSKTGSDYILECSPDLYIGMSFEEFVDVICKIPDSEADFHFCSQIYLMLYPNGLFPMNYLCNIENLDFHIKEIKKKTGIPFMTLSELNSSDKPPYESIYTTEMIGKVRRRYQADIEFFKYEFGKKNKTFTFGDVSGEWKKHIAEHPLMYSLLREKNQELQQQLALRVAPQTKEIRNLKKENITLQAELENIKKSISWKMTSPLRSLITFVSGKYGISK